MNAKTWYKENLGMLIRRKRQAMGLTKSELAFRTGLDDKHIGNLERGTKLPNSFTLAKIIVALDLDLNPLLSEFEKLYFDGDEKVFKR